MTKRIFPGAVTPRMTPFSARIFPPLMPCYIDVLEFGAFHSLLTVSPGDPVRDLVVLSSKHDHLILSS